MADGSTFYTLHGIDITLSTASLSTMKGTTAALDEWKDSLIDKIYREESRRFKFDSSTSEVIALVRQIAGGRDKESSALAIANRLLQKEKVAQEKRANFVTIQKGALFQTLTKHQGNTAYLLAKIEHEEFLDEIDLQKHSGLPFGRHIFKTCFITFNDEDEVLDVLVSDSKRQKISEYWSYDFLEVRELTSNEQNTRAAFKVLDQFITKNLKGKHPADYIQVRNNLVGYFRTTETFSFSEMIERVVGTYEPEAAGLDIARFRKDLKELPSKLKDDSVFEQRFDIIKGEITARFKKVIELSDKMTLKFKEDIPDLERVITAIEHDGKKCIRIETDQGYEYFKKEKQRSHVASN